MATTETTHTDDIVRRNLKRELPCKLTTEEFLRISKERVAKEAELGQLQDDLARETKKRKEQIEELSDEIEKKGRELHLEQQDRTVLCNEIFRRGSDGTGWIHTIRLDTFDEVERRPATAHETQRYLPNVEGPGANPSILDKARERQRSAQPDDGSDIPGDAPAEGDAPAGEEEGAAEEGEGKPKSRRSKRAEQ